MSYLTWLPDILRDAGVPVVTMSGWETRTTRRSGMPERPPGVIGHHTATGTGWSDGQVAALLRNGHRHLSGPLAQCGLQRDGTWVIVAAGRCNHDGYGRWGNSSIGVEAYNSGVGEPWPTIQTDSWVVGTAAILDHLGHDETRWLGHRESANHKIDPKGIDCDAFRASLRHRLANPAPAIPTPTPTEGDDDDMPKLYKRSDDDKVWLTDFLSRRHVKTTTELAQLEFMLSTETVVVPADGAEWLNRIPAALTMAEIVHGLDVALADVGVAVDGEAIEQAVRRVFADAAVE